MTKQEITEKLTQLWNLLDKVQPNVLANNYSFFKGCMPALKGALEYLEPEEKHLTAKPSVFKKKGK